MKTKRRIPGRELGMGEREEEAIGARGTCRFRRWWRSGR